MKKKIGWCAAGLLALAMVVHASVIVYNAVLIDEAALAYDNTYSVDIQSVGINAISAQATYSSATIANVSFTDGSQSTGSITVINYASLSTAAASNNVTVASNSGSLGASLVLPGYVLKEGLDWAVRDVSSNTAKSLASALSLIPFLSVSRVGSVVYTTAPFGSYYNSFQMVSSTPSALTVATPNFTGGRDNANIRINGVILRQGVDFTATTSNAATATSIKNAINANALLGAKLLAGSSGALVTSTSTLVGSLYNYSTLSSTPAALSMSDLTMTGGTDAADVLSSSVINIASHGFSTALPLLYGAAVGTIGGLTNQTTYYAVVLNSNNIKLATSKANALLGTGVVVTSTSTQLSAHTYSLAPLAIAGVPSFKWQVSNDNIYWLDLAVSSVTVSSYTNPNANILWSFGYIGTRYLRMNVVAPTAGGLGLRVRVLGTN